MNVYKYLSPISLVLAISLGAIGQSAFSYDLSCLEKQALKQVRTIKLNTSLSTMSNEKEIAQSLPESKEETYETALEDILSSRYGVAEYKLEKLKASNPSAFSDGPGYYFLGCACFGNGHYRQAIEYLQEASRLRQDDASVKIVLASAYSWSGDFENDERVLLDALALLSAQPQTSEYMNDQVAILIRLSAGAYYKWQFDKSEKYRKQAESLLDALDNLRTVEADGNLPREALASAKTAILDADLHRFELLSALASRHFSQHNYHEALPLYEQACAILERLEVDECKRLWLSIRKFNLLDEMVACAQVLNTETTYEHDLPGLAVDADKEQMLPMYKTLESIRAIKLLYSPYIIGNRVKKADAGMAEDRYISMQRAQLANPEAKYLPLSTAYQLTSFARAEYSLGEKTKARMLNKEAQEQYSDLLTKDLKSLEMEARVGMVLALRDAIKYELDGGNMREARKLMDKARKVTEDVLKLRVKRGDAPFQYAFLADSLLGYSKALSEQEKLTLVESGLSAIEDALKVSPNHAGAKMFYMALLSRKADILSLNKNYSSSDECFRLAQGVGNELISTSKDNFLVDMNLLDICWKRAKLAKSQGHYAEAREIATELIRVGKKLSSGRFYKSNAARNLAQAQLFLDELNKLHTNSK